MEKRLKPLYMIVSDKGGVGKTTVACVLADHAKHQSKPVALWDFDAAVKGFSRIYGANDNDCLTGVELVNPDNQESFINFLGQLETISQQVDYGVIDTPGGLVQRWSEQKTVIPEPVMFSSTLESYGWRLVFISVIGTDLQSAQGVFNLIANYQTNAAYAVVKNGHYGRLGSNAKSDFHYYDPASLLQGAHHKYPGHDNSLSEAIDLIGGKTFSLASINSNYVSDIMRKLSKPYHHFTGSDIGGASMYLVTWLAAIRSLASQIENEWSVCDDK